MKSNPKHADVEFVCVGSIQEHDRQKLVQLSRELGIESSCHFLGFVDDSELACLYAQTIALVYPSFYEGFGMPPVEAYFLGALPLVSDVSSLPEIVPIPELRFDPYSETSIADHMSFVFSLSKEQRSEYSVLLKKHAEKFNWEYAARVFWQGIQ